jgi:DNA topoisomerase-3
LIYDRHKPVITQYGAAACSGGQFRKLAQIADRLRRLRNANGSVGGVFCLNYITGEYIVVQRLTPCAKSPNASSAAAGGPPLLGAAGGNGPGTFPPTPAMKHFADSLIRQKGIKPPPGYKTSISICRKFLNEHAPKKAGVGTAGKHEPKPVSPAQMLYAKKIAQGKGVIIPDEAKANSAAMSAWIDSNRGTKRRKRGRKTAYKPMGSIEPQSTAPTKRSRKRTAATAAAPPAPAQAKSITGTPLRIPYGNKEVALKLGARYGAGGWYAPPGADLAAFGERGWL